MKLGIVGAGGIGSYYAGVFSHAGFPIHDVATAIFEATTASADRTAESA